ncbi:MAG: Rrf2 family transcriptional regulator [Planctomycetaceae bacterium]|nr:Rrf2 family transcriptional regulator [Planctomycetaceae bacterium]
MSLKISAKTEYACIAIMELAIHKNSTEPVRIRNIAERHSVPPRFLVQILLQLKSADIVESTRGATGGYRLKKSPEEVTLGQIMNIIETPLNNGKRMLNQTNGESEAAIVLSNIWNSAEKCRQDFLNNITFADLIKHANKKDIP